MAIDFKKELEQAAKNMILVHEPSTLLKMIIRLIVQKVKVSHAGILLHDESRQTYVLRISGGPRGIKVPSEYARMDYNNPLISIFRDYRDKDFFADGFILSTEEARRFLKAKIAPGLRVVLHGALAQMETLDAIACIPSFYQNDLLGILFLGKKTNGNRFYTGELNFFVALASHAAMALQNANLFTQLQSELSKREELFISTTVALAEAIEAKDHYTRGHTARVTHLCTEMGHVLTQKDGLRHDGKFLKQLRIAALLHDIGKIGIPESILNKKAALTDKEWEKMKEHPVIGANILQSIRELREVIKGVKYHHESYNGKGYPEGLKDDQIPLIATVITVADAYDAMTTDRPYRRALTKEEATNEIKRGSGKQFNPDIVPIFLKLRQESII